MQPLVCVCVAEGEGSFGYVGLHVGLSVVFENRQTACEWRNIGRARMEGCGVSRNGQLLQFE